MVSANFDRYYNAQFYNFLEINERNKKARNIVAMIYKESTVVDSQTEYSAAKACITLDRMGIHKSNLVKLFSGICGNKIESLFSLTKAHESGLLSREDIHLALQSNNSCQFKSIQILISTTPYNKIQKGEPHAEASIVG